MVDVLGARCQNLLLCSTLDGNRSVGPGDCFSLHDGLPSETALFELPKRLGAAAVLIGTTAVRSVLEPDAADIALTRRLIAAGVATGIPVLEHILVKDNRFRLMRESLEGGLLDY
jgi:hypothetical protein